MNDVDPDDQDRIDRFTWHEDDVIWTALPNARGSIVEVGQRVRFGDGYGVVKALVGVNEAVVVTAEGQSLTVALDELEPTE